MYLPSGKVYRLPVDAKVRKRMLVVSPPLLGVAPSLLNDYYSIKTPIHFCACLRLTRFQRTPAWAPSLPSRATTLSNPSIPAARPEGNDLCVDRAASTHVPATSALPREGNTSCADVHKGKPEASIDAGDAKGRGARDEGGAVRFGGGTRGRLHAGPTPAHVFFVEGEEVVKKRTASPKEEHGVTAGARQGGRNPESGGDVARTDALTTTKQRVEQGAYALVQLSTRCVSF